MGKRIEIKFLSDLDRRLGVFANTHPLLFITIPALTGLILAAIIIVTCLRD